MTGRPTAAPAYFPYHHESMAVVMANECTGCFVPISRANVSRLCPSCNGKRQGAQTGKMSSDRARYERERRSVAG